MKSNATNESGNVLFLRYSNFIFILCYLYHIKFFDCVSTRFSILWKWVTQNIVRPEMRSIILLFHMGFRLPRKARSTPHSPCLRPETKSIIVLFHIGCRLSHEARFVSKYSLVFQNIVLGPKYFWILIFLSK